MNIRADIETLRRIPIFSDCDPVHLQLIAFSAERVSFEAGQAIIREGAEAAAACLVLGGEAVLSTIGEGRIGSAGPGAMLGEIAMIGERPYAVTATAVEPVTAARISRELFMRVAREFPDFGAAVFRVLAARLDQSMREIGAARLGFDAARSFKDI
ncbi:MAG: Crp/Fnr family transcriptional regulator [Aestuariivirga sp.]|uniref:Crp/Fnr family transcriptional regulator n=1 Tax=Aestuariivirga sp. TaxID=2650926 RepID=UPI0038D1BD4A